MTSILLDLPTNRQPPGGGPSYASLFSQGDSSSLLPSLALTGIFIRKWCRYSFEPWMQNLLPAVPGKMLTFAGTASSKLFFYNFKDCCCSVLCRKCALCIVEVCTVHSALRRKTTSVRHRQLQSGGTETITDPN